MISDPKTRMTLLAESLLLHWTEGLYRNQRNQPEDPSVHGGLFSPGDGNLLGRGADAVLPFLWRAERSGEEKFRDAALKVYAWEQANGSAADGGWYNNPGEPDGWKGITVFAAMTKLESITTYRTLLGEAVVAEWEQRLHLAAEFILRHFNLTYGNINYSATATLALYEMGHYFNETRFLDKAAELAEGILDRFTPEGLLWGEGGHQPNQQGQFPVDLGYNVEESLPALGLYSLRSGHQELQERVVRSLQTHLEFMLPNGGWDNSWGTRNYKWTLWGSRTSDGCQLGYLLFADRDPVFAEAALRNLECLEACTHDHLLTSGPHEHLTGIPSSLHPTVEHAKALVTLLHTPWPDPVEPQAGLPRERDYGIQTFDSIHTTLFSHGLWRGTVTGYNVHYKDGNTDGHCSGGGLSCLYHLDAGMITAASMTAYQRWEGQNMLPEPAGVPFLCLTPRLEWPLPDGQVYRNINDPHAEIRTEQQEENLCIHTRARLTNGSGETPEGGSPQVAITYSITPYVLRLKLELDNKPDQGNLRFHFPVVCSNEDVVTTQGNCLWVQKADVLLRIHSNHSWDPLLSLTERGYNPVPGLQAFPLQFNIDTLYPASFELTLSTQRP